MDGHQAEKKGLFVLDGSICMMKVRTELYTGQNSFCKLNFDFTAFKDKIPFPSLSLFLKNCF